MTTSDRTRSISEGISSALPPPSPLTAGVGGRRAPLPPLPGGGGYLDNCTPAEFPDPRLTDLAAMRFPPVWLRVAEKIGVDALLTLWEELDRCDSVPRTDNGMLLLRLRPFASWKRNERNRYIRALAASGGSPQQIQEALKRNLGIELGLDAITRAARR